MQYNKTERLIAYFLSKSPRLKLAIKKVYQQLNYLRYKKNYNFKSEYKITKLTYKNKESFFGYYDKSPINRTNEYIVFHSPNISTQQMPNPSIPVDIILYNIKNNKYKKIDESLAYNWQQGSKLMWVDDYKFIYNVFERNKYRSKIFDLQKNIFKVIDFPIYDTFKDEFSISLNFHRLGVGRGDYTYKNKNIKIDWGENKNDGLYYVDLKNNETKLILSLQDIIDFNYKESMKNARHKFNHIMISPDGKKVMFMHRWFLENGRKFDTLLISNIDGTDLKIVVDKEMVSHCYWYDDENIFGYLREFDGDKYYLININTLEKEVLGKGIIDSYGDGHPTIYNKKIVFDTYPNKARMLELFLFDTKNDNLEKIGEFFQSFDFYGETRCDLHPRFSYDGRSVFFDSVHEGKRYLYMIDIEK